MPAGLHGTLRDYQRQGLTWLAELTSHGLGACLADDMGLGKTITLIALHLHRVEAGPRRARRSSSARPACWATGSRSSPGSRRASPVRRFHGGSRSLDGADPTGSCSRRTAPCGSATTSSPRSAGTSWSPTRRSTSRTRAPPRPRRCARSRARVRVALTGTPVENNLTELWAILDWVIPGLLGSRHAFRKVWAAPIEAGVHEAKTRQFADLIGPFLLRRRKSDPGIAPELPAKTETDHPLSLTREQVVLYESFVRDTMARIERAGHDDQVTRRGLVLALLTGLKQICNHPAHFLKESGAVRLTGRSQKLDLLDELLGTVLAEDGAALVFTQYVAMGRLLEAHLAQGRHPPPVPARRHAGPRARGDGARGSRPGEVAGLPALAQGRRHRPQPDPRRPRHPLRPLVEPRGRGAGHRPRLPDRPDQAGPGAPAGHPGHDRGAGRPAAGAQARARRRGARRRRGRADRARRRRAARPGHAAPRGRPPPWSGPSGRDHRRPPPHPGPPRRRPGHPLVGARRGSARSRRRRTPRPT